MQNSSDSAGAHPSDRSNLLKYDGRYPIEQWQEWIFRKQASLESYVLLELRHFKNVHDEKHEFLIGEFRAGSEALFIAAERGRGMQDDVVFTDAPKAALDTSPNRAPAKKSRGRLLPRRSQSKLVPKSPSPPPPPLAIDQLAVIPDKDSFDDAVESRYPSTSFISNGSVQYRSDTEPNVGYTSARQRPNLIHFTIAALAAHRTRPVWTTDAHTWYANAISYIFIEKFTPSEITITRIEQTPELFVKYDTCEKECKETPPEFSESDAELSQPGPTATQTSPEYLKLDVERQAHLKHAEEIEHDINSIKLEIQRLESLSPPEPATQKAEKKMKAKLERREADLQLSLAQAEQTEREIDVMLCEEARAECQNELDEYRMKIQELEQYLAASVKQ